MQDYSLVKEQIREAIDVVVLLEYNGAKINKRYSDHMDSVRSSCPIHGGDGDTNFSFDSNTKLWSCFSRRCGERPEALTSDQPIRDVYYFIQLCEERRTGKPCSFFKALEIASKLCGIPLTSENLTVSKETRDKLDNDKWVRQQKKLNKKVELSILDESILEEFRNNTNPYLLSRNYSEEIMNLFKLGYSPKGLEEPYNENRPDFPGRIIVPIRDDKGNLVGMSGRLATDDEALIKRYHKYKHKVDFDKGLVLYNFNRAKESINETNQVILCEGFFDVMRLWSYGLTNAVAVMGTALIPEQINLILSNCMEAYICMDGDKAGKQASNRIADQLYTVSTDAYIVQLPDSTDPDSIEAIDFWMAYSEAQKYVRKNPVNSLTKKRGYVII